MQPESEERMRDGVARRYRTEQIEVTWAPRLCTHSGRCFGRLPDVFDPGARPWVRPEAADPEEVELTVGRCPSGALGFRWLEADEAHTAAADRGGGDTG
jgi:uncharacterized Fe-S cluster protein YjdI